MTSSIYLAQGHLILKVGMTKSLKSRKSTLQKEFEKFGDTIIDFRTFEAGDRAFCAERDLIDKTAAIRKQFAGREWFVAGDFDEVVALAEKAVIYGKSFGPVLQVVRDTPSERAAYLRQIELRKERERTQRLENKARRQRLTTERKLRRLLRCIQVDCVAMWKSKGMLKPFAQPITLKAA